MDAKLIVGIVPRGAGDRVAAAARAGGAGGGTILPGRGTAPNAVLAALGLGETSKEVALFFAPGDRASAVRDAIVAGTAGERRHFGVLFAARAFGFGKTGFGAQAPEGTDMDEARNGNAYRMIGIIVNRGDAEDAMAAARAAGAGDGTILNGRGTAKPDDATFFGVPLVPEKEMLLILAEAARADAVLRAVQATPCLAKMGGGIAFCLPVDDFTVLGR